MAEYQTAPCTTTQDTLCTAKTCADTDGAGADYVCSSGHAYLQEHDAIADPSDSTCCKQALVAESDGMDPGTVIILVAVIMISVVCAVFICLRGGPGQSEDGKNTTKNPVGDMEIADEPLERE